jgi:hypothetical protein
MHRDIGPEIVEPSMAHIPADAPLDTPGEEIDKAFPRT